VSDFPHHSELRPDTHPDRSAEHKNYRSYYSTHVRSFCSGLYAGTYTGLYVEGLRSRYLSPIRGIYLILLILIFFTGLFFYSSWWQPKAPNWQYETHSMSAFQQEPILMQPVVVNKERAPDLAPILNGQVPIEIIENGSKPKWVLVNVAPRVAPEPGSTLLVLISALVLTFRRQRAS
jgi:hypothetical protein